MQTQDPFYDQFVREIPGPTGSVGIDTSAVDRYRSGVELTTGRHYGAATYVIRSADGRYEGDHRWVRTSFGAQPDRIDPGLAYADPPTWDPVTYVTFRRAGPSGSWNGFTASSERDGAADPFGRREGGFGCSDTEVVTVASSADREAAGAGPVWYEGRPGDGAATRSAFRDGLTRDGRTSLVVAIGSAFDTESQPSDAVRARAGFDFPGGFDSVTYGGLARS